MRLTFLTRRRFLVLSTATALGDISRTVRAQPASILGQPPVLDRSVLEENIQLVMELAELAGNELHLVGQIDPENLLKVNGTSQPINSLGEFDIKMQVGTKQEIMTLQITNPLGMYKTYKISLFKRFS